MNVMIKVKKVTYSTETGHAKGWMPIVCSTIMLTRLSSKCRKILKTRLAEYLYDKLYHKYKKHK